MNVVIATLSGGEESRCGNHDLIEAGFLVVRQQEWRSSRNDRLDDFASTLFEGVARLKVTW